MQISVYNLTVLTAVFSHKGNIKTRPFKLVPAFIKPLSLTVCACRGGM